MITCSSGVSGVTIVKATPPPPAPVSWRGILLATSMCFLFTIVNCGKYVFAHCWGRVGMRLATIWLLPQSIVHQLIGWRVTPLRVQNSRQTYLIVGVGSKQANKKGNTVKTNYLALVWSPCSWVSVRTLSRAGWETPRDARRQWLVSTRLCNIQ